LLCSVRVLVWLHSATASNQALYNQTIQTVGAETVQESQETCKGLYFELHCIKYNSVDQKPPTDSKARSVHKRTGSVQSNCKIGLNQMNTIGQD